jgi:hypothetical protein
MNVLSKTNASPFGNPVGSGFSFKKMWALPLRLNEEAFPFRFY